MNKLQKWFGAAAVLLCADFSLQAQQNFVQFFGNPYDHGVGHEVIQTINPANPGGYMVVGTALAPFPNNNPIVNVTEYTGPGAGGGVPIMTSFYPIITPPIGPSTIADGISIAAAPPFNVYGVLAYTDFTVPNQAVLFQININGTLNGIVTPLGDLRATSVIFDPTTNWFIVLGQSPNNGNDLQVIAVDAATGAVMGFNTFDSGPGFSDTPARLMQDPASNNFVLVGTSFDPVMMDNNVFVVHCGPAPGFPMLCSETVGSPGINEFGVDVTSGVSITGAQVDVVLGNILNGRQWTPFVIEMDPFNCPSFISSAIVTTYDTPNNRATGITYDPVNMFYDICGMNLDAAGPFGFNTNGFVEVITNAFGPVVYSRAGQPVTFPGDEDFTDILYDPAPAFGGLLITTGEHQLLNPWPGFPTPPGESFEWLVVNNTMGMDGCPDVRHARTVPYCPEDIQQFWQMPWFNQSPVTVLQYFGGWVFLDECTNPFRMDGSTDSNSGGTVSIFPNPAGQTISITYSSLLREEQPVLEVMNMAGEMVLKQTLDAGDDQQADVDVSTLAPGVYLFRVMSGNIELTNEKITIQR